jgi:hypothetical protein
MTATAANDHAGAGEAGEASEVSQALAPSSGNGSGPGPRKWVVDISLESRQVGRRAWEGTSDRNADPQVEDVIWPTWPATIQDETAVSASPLADLQQYWSTAGNRLRESAKWMATVLGAALATVVGASPLADLSSDHLQVWAAVIGFAGLASLGVTMVLVLRVMQPPAVSLEEVQEARPTNGLGRFMPAWIYRHKESSLYRWKRIVESHPDLYLPCGVDSVDELRSFIRLEEATLVALSVTKEDTTRTGADNLVGSAQTAGAARLLELRTAAARITAIGEYYALRARSVQATYGGTTFGIIGTALIVLAFAWPLR